MTNQVKAEKEEVRYEPGQVKTCVEASIKTLASLPNRYFIGDDRKLRVRTSEGSYTMASREIVLADLDEYLHFVNRDDEAILPPPTVVSAILKYGQTGTPGMFKPLPSAEQQSRARVLELTAQGLNEFEIADRLWSEFDFIKREPRNTVVSRVEQILSERKK
jgi:hypothetical protein